jgi:hypothetical protein
MWELSNHLCGVKDAEAVDQKFISELTLLLYESGLDSTTRVSISNRIGLWQIRLKHMRRNLQRAVLHRSTKMRFSAGETAVNQELSETIVINVLRAILAWYGRMSYTDRLEFITTEHSKSEAVVACLLMGYDYLTGYYKGMEYIQAVLPVVNVPLELLLVLKDSLGLATTDDTELSQITELIAAAMRYGIFPVEVTVGEMAEFKQFIEVANLRSRRN